MKRVIKKIQQIMFVPALMLGLLGFAASSFAQSTASPQPNKHIPDNMLHKRAAIEVMERAIGEWGSLMVNTDPASAEYPKVVANYAVLFAASNFLMDTEKYNISTCIEEGAKLAWADGIITDPVAYSDAINEVRKLLNKSKNPNFKENY